MARNESSALREIASEGEGWPTDLLLSVIERETKDGVNRLRVAGLHRGERVGFEIRVEAKPGGIPLLGRVFYPTHVSIFSVGDESDSFSRAVAHAYGVPISEAAGMPPRLEFEAMSLEGNPANLDGGSVRLKLFNEGRGGGPDEEADSLGVFEWFLVIDTASGVVALKEKDSTYRESIISALCILMN